MRAILKPWTAFTGLGAALLMGCSFPHHANRARTEITPLERAILAEPAGAINPDQQVRSALASVDELLHREEGPLLKREEYKGVKRERRPALDLAAVTP